MYTHYGISYQKIISADFKRHRFEILDMDGRKIDKLLVSVI